MTSITWTAYENNFCNAYIDLPTKKYSYRQSYVNILQQSYNFKTERFLIYLFICDLFAFLRAIFSITRISKDLYYISTIFWQLFFYTHSFYCQSAVTHAMIKLRVKNSQLVDCWIRTRACKAANLNNIFQKFVKKIFFVKSQHARSIFTNTSVPRNCGSLLRVFRKHLCFCITCPPV